MQGTRLSSVVTGYQILDVMQCGGVGLIVLLASLGTQKQGHSLSEAGFAPYLSG